MELVSLFSIIAAVIVFIILVYRGTVVVIAATLASIIIILGSGMGDIMTALLEVYMPGMVSFAKSYLLLFCLSALFGRLVADSGAAYSIAAKVTRVADRIKDPKWRNFSIAMVMPIVGMILAASGISMYVIAFTLVAIAKPLFKANDLPWHFYAFITFGTGTMTFCILPGLPTTDNLIPMEYLGTTPMAGAAIGIICGVAMFIMMALYIKWQTGKALAKGEGYLPSGAWVDEWDIDKSVEGRKEHSLLVSLIPIIAPLILLNVFGLKAEPALLGGCIITFILFYKDIKAAGSLKDTLNNGFTSAILPLIGVCAATGFGKVIVAAPGFNFFTDLMARIPGPEILQMIVASWLLCFLMGTSAGAQPTIMDLYADKMLAAGYDPGFIHRISAMATMSGAAPHGGSITNNLTVPRVGHKYGYRHYIWCYFICGPICVALGAVIGLMIY